VSITKSQRPVALIIAPPLLLPSLALHSIALARRTVEAPRAV